MKWGLPGLMIAGYLFAGLFSGGWIPNLWILLTALASFAAGYSARPRARENDPARPPGEGS